MVDYLMKLNNTHVCNLDVVSDMVEEMLPDMFHTIDVMAKTIEKFNESNAPLHLRAFCTLDDVKTNAFQDEELDDVLFKALKLKYRKKNLKRGFEDDQSYFMTKRNKKSSVLFLKICYSNNSYDSWIIDTDSSATNHVCNSLRS